MAKYWCALWRIGCLCCIIQVYANEESRTGIHNGIKVPDPCNPPPDIFWSDKGLDFPGCGRPRNPFDEDFNHI